MDNSLMIGAVSHGDRLVISEKSISSTNLRGMVDSFFRIGTTVHGEQMTEPCITESTTRMVAPTGTTKTVDLKEVQIRHQNMSKMKTITAMTGMTQDVPIAMGPAMMLLMAVNANTAAVWEKDGERIMKLYNCSLKEIDGFYATLMPVHMRLFRIFMDGDLAFESGYSIDHLLDGKDGICSPSFPLPVIEVTGICDIFVNFESIDFYAYVPAVPNDDVCKRFCIQEKKQFSCCNGLWKFRMPMSVDDQTIYDFVKELLKMGAVV